MLSIALSILNNWGWTTNMPLSLPVSFVPTQFSMPKLVTTRRAIENNDTFHSQVMEPVASRKEKIRKDYASQVQLRALRKGPLTSKLARASPRRGTATAAAVAVAAVTRKLLGPLMILVQQESVRILLGQGESERPGAWPTTL
eukprot:1152050-Pelagomonas_calceolata.AAC.4